MSKLIQFDRRSFIKGASIGAAAGSLASVTNLATAAEIRPGGMKNGKFDFDEYFDRDGTGMSNGISSMLVLVRKVLILEWVSLIPTSEVLQLSKRQF